MTYNDVIINVSNSVSQVSQLRTICRKKQLAMAQDPLKAEAPPAYNDIVKDAPPPYSEVFGVKEIRAQMQEARGEGGSPAKAGLKICNLLCGSIVCGVFVIVLAALPLAMIVIGSMNVHNCSISSLVPIFLIVFGCVSLIQTGIHIFRLCCGRKDDERSERANQGSNCCETIISIFLFVWIIIGSYWVFSLWNVWNSSTCNQGAECCDPVLVYFSFVTMLLIYATGILCCCCLVCCVFCCAFFAAGAGAAASSS